MSNPSRFTGVTGNLVPGATNANVGGVVYRATGQSSNQFPVSAASMEYANGGSAPSPTTSSNSPAAMQENVASRVKTQVVAQSSYSNIAGKGMGELTSYPRTTEVIDFSKVNGSSTIVREQNTNAYVGITENKTFIVNELTRFADMRTKMLNDGQASEIDGAAKIGDPNVLYTTTQRELSVSNSNKLGETSTSTAPKKDAPKFNVDPNIEAPNLLDG